MTESEAAARFLASRGFRILVRNYHAPSGEIDLIARDGDSLVFVEVKTRRGGTPADAVNDEKQRRLTLASVHFLKAHRALEVRSRFDVVAIVWPEGGSAPVIEHIRNAFDSVGRYQMFR